MNQELNLDKLKKAQSIFEKFRLNMNNDRDKAGAIQAFEFCYELAWKSMKRALSLQGQETGSPKDTFRKAAKEAIIDDPELWFEFQKKRNLTVHTYELENVDSILEAFESFSKELKILITRMEKIH